MFKKSYMLIWSLSSDIYRFRVFLKDSQMDKISLHNNEIMHVSYSERLEKVISYDKSNKAVVWDINTLKSCQILIFENSINYLFPLRGSSQVLAIGSSSFLLEKVGLTEFLGDFTLWGATYDPNSKRFLVLTNQEVRYLNFLKGDMERVFIHQRTDIYPNHKFHAMVKLRQGQQMFLSLNSQKQFCLYNYRTMQLYKAVHSIEEHKNETPSSFFFIRELELLAVGYVESKIKGSLTSLRHQQPQPQAQLREDLHAGPRLFRNHLHQLPRGPLDFGVQERNAGALEPLQQPGHPHPPLCQGGRFQNRVRQRKMLLGCVQRLPDFRFPVHTRASKGDEFFALQVL